MTLTVEPPLMLTPESTTLRVPLGANAVATVHIEGFDGVAAITLRDPNGLLDPRILLTDANNRIIAANDDHGTADVTLNRFDARMIAEIRTARCCRSPNFGARGLG